MFFAAGLLPCEKGVDAPQTQTQAQTGREDRPRGPAFITTASWKPKFPEAYWQTSVAILEVKLNPETGRVGLLELGSRNATLRRSSEESRHVLSEDAL